MFYTSFQVKSLLLKSGAHIIYPCLYLNIQINLFADLTRRYDPVSPAQVYLTQETTNLKRGVRGYKCSYGNLRDITYLYISISIYKQMSKLKRIFINMIFVFSLTMQIKFASPQAAWLSELLQENQQCCTSVRDLGG